MYVRLMCYLAALVAALGLFAWWPQIDVALAQWTFEHLGLIGQTKAAQSVRTVLRATPFVVLGLFAGLLLLRRAGFSVPYAPSGRALLFLALTMLIGPGLLINVGLKQHSHRPRPIHTDIYAGDAKFRPWYAFDGACGRGCSFASGEASTGFWMIAPASLLPPPLQAPALVVATLFGIVASGLRVAFGAHFLSDVVIAALLTLVVVEATAIVLFRRATPP